MINYVKVTISAVIAFLMSILVAFLIEMFGGAIGSVIGTIPSTIIPASYIIMTSDGSTKEAKVESLIACLFGMFATDILFMPSWKIIPPRLPKKWRNGTKVLITTLLSLAIWCVGAVLMSYVQIYLCSLGISAWVFGIGLFVFTACCGIVLCWRLPPTPPGKNKVKWYTHLSRGIAASVAIFFSGVLSQMDAGVAAGAMATFPAIFGTTMVSVSLAQGADVSTGAIGPLLMGGMCVGVYSLITAFIFQSTDWNPLWCCCISFVASISCWSIPVFFFIRWRRDKTEELTKKVISTISRGDLEMKQISFNNEAKPTTMNNHDLMHANPIIPSTETPIHPSSVEILKKE